MQVKHILDSKFPAGIIFLHTDLPGIINPAQIQRASGRCELVLLQARIHPGCPHLCGRLFSQGSLVRKRAVRGPAAPLSSNKVTVLSFETVIKAGGTTSSPSSCTIGDFDFVAMERKEKC